MLKINGSGSNQPRKTRNVIMGIAYFLRHKKYLGIGALLTTVVFLLILSEPKDQAVPIILDGLVFYQQSFDNRTIEEWWSLRKSLNNPSELGEILFLNASEPKTDQSKKKYQILVWKYGSTIENRHLKHFSGRKIDPFEYCPVSNCDITYSDQALDTADIVIFHLHRIVGTNDLPKKTNPDQIWAFLTDESPYHTFLHRNVKLKDFNGVFNWSMTYRTDSDIPVPYGRTVLKKNFDPTVEVKLGKRRDVLVSIMGSNCNGKNHRWQYVHKLQEYIQVDIYGACGPFKDCPGHFKADCPAIRKYLFYLSFENSNCDEYITEKLWWNAYQKNSIPIVMGSDKTNYNKLLPPHSYINTEDFATPKDLAQYLLEINKTEDFKNYYRWKANFEIKNEHGYFRSQSYHYCRVCQALNYNSRKPKVYDKLEDFWSVEKNCHPAWDSWKD